MEKENKLSSSNSGDLELESSEGEENVSEAEDLETSEKEEEYYKKLTGREDIKGKEDFEKHYKELSSFVGQNPKELKEKAEAFDQMIEDANKIVDEAEETGEIPPLEKEMPELAEVSSLRDEFDDMKFLKKNPQAETFIDVIKAVAKEKGISREEAYQDNLKDLITTKLEADKTKEEEKSRVVESKTRVAPGMTAGVNKLIEEVQKTDSIDAKQKLVEKILELSK